ncbi:MAG: hypothetical protein ACK5XN_02365, partial [Bacteroidota bacterium]
RWLWQDDGDSENHIASHDPAESMPSAGFSTLREIAGHDLGELVPISVEDDSIPSGKNNPLVLRSHARRLTSLFFTHIHLHT